MKYKEYKKLDFPAFEKEVAAFWKEEDIFGKSVSHRDGKPTFTFYEGPPSANGKPGIHHVISRTIKDTFCRYKTLKGFKVNRKGGWDTHGLPIELQVEKALGITKEDIGKKISVEDYNKACREAVMQFKADWDNLTEQIGYWVDLDNPYITYDNSYIETCWNLLQRLYNKGLLYKGYTIQPYSPAAGTGLSSHELNQPGTYKDVKDTTIVAQFKAIKDDASAFLFENATSDVFFLAWTTTPWTLPSNTALAVGKNIEYVVVDTVNQYTGIPIRVVLAKDLVIKNFGKTIKFEPDIIFRYILGEEDSYVNAPDVSFSKQIILNGEKSIVTIGHGMLLTVNLLIEHANRVNAKRVFNIVNDNNENVIEEGEITIYNIPFHKIYLADTSIPELNNFIRKQVTEPYFKILTTLKSSQLDGLRYEQLLPYATSAEEGDSFKVIVGDFVTTEDGTGIVHIAPTFGADDMRVAKQNGIAPLLVKDEGGNLVPLVDLRGRFRPEMGEFAGEFVKEQYLSDAEKEAERVKQGRDKYLSVDERISIKLKQENRAFKVEKYEHTYPHCWRTDKPVLYYPLSSWFIKTTAVKDRLIELNKTINWKPESTGTGRFGDWLNNLVDWNLSRSRYWGTPLPIWRTEDGTEEICIGSLAELVAEIDKAVAAGVMDHNPYKKHSGADVNEFGTADGIDLHRPYVDHVVLVSPSGKPMKREADLIDVWFDSGAMPYAQWHWPFENQEQFESNFPADFIAEGVDQTRGWFFTLHALGVMLFDSVAYKNVVANGLVLDKNGNKMSKRLGNSVDPFEAVSQYGADAVRWYMLSNSPPWDNLKFDVEGVKETQRKFFATLYNVYGFFALYANVDGFTFAEDEIPLEQRPEIDRWVLSLLNSLIQEVEKAADEYDPTRPTRAIEEFVTEHLSNWYVRLCRRRFWKGEYAQDKIAAYQTLYTCLSTVTKLMASFAPFYADMLFRDLNNVSKKENSQSVHLSDFPAVNTKAIDKTLEAQMQLAQDISSMVLSLRKKVNIKVRQPLQKILVPVSNNTFAENLQHVKDLILSEVNVKELEYLTDDTLKLVKKVKPNFKTLGAKLGQNMKVLAGKVAELTQDEIRLLESEGGLDIQLGEENFRLLLADAEIISEDVPGWQVAVNGSLTVALDVNVSDELLKEGIAREFINRMQNLRKEAGFEVTDKIHVAVQEHPQVGPAIIEYKNYICAEILAQDLQLAPTITNGKTIDINEIDIYVTISKVQTNN